MIAGELPDGLLDLGVHLQVDLGFPFHEILLLKLCVDVEIALPLGDLGQRARQFFRRLAGLHALIGAHVDGANAGFHPGVHGAGRASAVSCLGVGVVGLDQGGAGHLVPGQVVLLAGGRRAAIDGMLAIKDTRGGERGDAHPVTNHQDDILRALRPIHHFQAGIKCSAAIGPPAVLHRRIEHRGS